jgi:Domain of unknown function (DUF927)
MVTLFNGHQPKPLKVITGEYSSIFAGLKMPQKRREKSGAAGIIFGEVRGNRSNANIASLCALVVDIDNGQSLAEVQALMENIRHPSLLYTTHSHLKSETYVPVANFQKFRKTPKAEGPSIEEISAYLASVGKDYLEVVSVAAETVKRHRKQCIVVRHQPIHKMRLVFPLREPFQFSDDEDTHVREEALWSMIYKTVCAKLGFSYDEATADAARFYYYPSCKPDHADDHVSEAFNENAPLLDLSDYHDLTLEDVKSVARKMAGAKKTSAAGGAMVSHDGFPLTVWAAKHAATFMIAEAIENNNPDLLGSSAFNGEGVHLNECPFELEHSSPAGSRTAVKDGDGDEGFVITCRGNACQSANDGKGRDRLEYVAKMLADGWLTIDDLQNPDFGGGSVDSDTDFNSLRRAVIKYQAVAKNEQSEDVPKQDSKSNEPAYVALPSGFQYEEDSKLLTMFQGKGKKRKDICDGITFTALARDYEAGEWLLVCEVVTPDGKTNRVYLPKRYAGKDSSIEELRAAGGGVYDTPGMKKVLSYVEPDRLVRIVAKGGWYQTNEGKDIFVLTGDEVEVFGDSSGEDVIYRPSGELRPKFNTAGDLSDWQRAIATPVQGNSRLEFVLCMSFAAPLLTPYGIGGGGFHLVGGKLYRQNDCCLCEWFCLGWA